MAGNSEPSRVSIPSQATLPPFHLSEVTEGARSADASFFGKTRMTIGEQGGETVGKRRGHVTCAAGKIPAATVRRWGQYSAPETNALCGRGPKGGSRVRWGRW